MQLKLTLDAKTLMYVVVVALAAAPAAPTHAGAVSLTLTVNTNATDAIDASPGDGVCAAANATCTLRAAVMEANAWPGADTILIPGGIYALKLPATAHENAALDGDLDLTDDVTIIGAGQGGTIVDGNSAVTQARVFSVEPGVSAELSELTIRNGTNEPGPGIVGGLLNLGTVTLNHVALNSNNNGGLDNKGTATLEYVTYSGNFGSAAGLSSTNGGSITIVNSTIADNLNEGNAGGLWVGPGSLLMINSVVSGNRALGQSNGGGVVVFDGAATIINSTVSGNWAGFNGGGLYAGTSQDGVTTVNLYNVTLAANIADSDNNGGGAGGGVFVGEGSVTVTLANGLIANNRHAFVFSADDDCSGPLHLGGYNLLETTTSCSLQGDATGLVTGQDPALSVLGSHGGATFTHALLGNSPAIGAGNPAGCADNLGQSLTTDQRGFVRAGQAGRCDLGAYEYLAAPPQLVFLPLVRR